MKKFTALPLTGFDHLQREHFRKEFVTQEEAETYSMALMDKVMSKCTYEDGRVELIGKRDGNSAFVMIVKFDTRIKKAL